MFEDREDGGRQLARRFDRRKLQNPLVLGIPRGGVATAAVLARELGGELDVVLSRKLRAPYQPELAIGAIGEDGEVVLNEFAREVPGVTERYIDEERDRQMAEIARRRALFRAVKKPAEVAGRSVIVTDDGIATGSTMQAALHVLRAKRPHELIMAVPVAPPETLERFRALCDRVECVLAPEFFGAVGAFYRDFRQVEDEEVVRLLRESVRAEPVRP
jgi:putative phosphoribosyl transferase